MQTSFPPFTLVNTLGSSQSTEVFLARDGGGTQDVELRILRRELAANATTAQRFLDQAAAVEKVSHPSLGRLLSHGRGDDGRPWLATEHFDDETLARHLRQGTPLSTAELIRMAVPLCESLAALHQSGLLHGDLRPEHVVLVGGLGGTPKLIASGLPRMFEVAPDLFYAAPETLAGNAPTPASEVYAMGAMLYEAVTGTPPFVGRTDDELRRRHREEIPVPLTGGHAPLAGVIARCLEKDPDQRPASANQLATMLRLCRLPETIAPDQASLIDSRLGGPSGEELVREKPGDLLGSYQLVKLLGAGAMGRVYLAQHVKLGRQVALKVLRTRQTYDPANVQRFFQEARTVNQINHEHIVEVFDFVEELTPDGLNLVFCVMELLAGGSLAQVLAQEHLPLSRIINITRQICDALAAAHGVGVVHRDIKPDNVFITARSGLHDYVKVLDFGVAKVGAVPGALAEAEGEGMVGTPLYMSPEQAAGMEVDARADIYAVGNLLYEMLTGRPPFEAPDFSKLAAQVITREPPPLPEKSIAGEKIPPGLKEQVMRALAKEPRQRHASMGELAEAIAPFGVVTEVLKRPPPQSRGARRAVVGVVTLTALVAVGAGVGLAMRGSPEQKIVTVEAPAPPPATHVQLMVESEPKGAHVVRLDTGVELGLTPLTVRVPRGDAEVTIAVRLDGHRAAEQRVRFDSNLALNFSLDTVDAPARPAASKPKKKQKLTRESTLDPFAN